MKHLLIIILTTLLVNSAGAQTIQQIDSVAAEICESIKKLKEVNREEVKFVFQKHLPDFFLTFNVQSETLADSLVDRIVYRMQRDCPGLTEVTDKLEENKSDWVILKRKPKSKISKDMCAIILNGGNYYYKEYDGKIVNVTITQDSWRETFEDGTQSHLLIHINKNCEFELEFVESNNKSRKNLSIKGDVYQYGIYDANEGVYNIWTRIQGGKEISAFKLYPR